MKAATEIWRWQLGEQRRLEISASCWLWQAANIHHVSPCGGGGGGATCVEPGVSKAEVEFISHHIEDLEMLMFFLHLLFCIFFRCCKAAAWWHPYSEKEAWRNTLKETISCFIYLFLNVEKHSVHCVLICIYCICCHCSLALIMEKLQLAEALWIQIDMGTAK